MKDRIIALGLAAALSLTALSKPSAAAFKPIQPATCPSTTEVPFTYNVGNQGTREWMAANNLNVPDQYNDDIHYNIGLLANQKVFQFGMRYDFLDTEPCCDFLETSTANSSRRQAGAAAPGWVDTQTTNPFFQSGSLTFHSDFSVGGRGVSIGKARVCTTKPGDVASYTPRSVVPAQRYAGVLLGTDDVVFVSAPVGSAKTGDACNSAHDTFALWGDESSGNDYDMFVRCNALPTPSQFDFAATSGNTQEFIHATGASCPCGGTWFIAIQSFRGTGAFSFVNHKHYASEHKTANVPTTAEADLTPADVASFSQDVQRGFRHFFGANEGARYWDTYSFRDRSIDGDIRIYNSQGRPNADVCGSGCGPFQGKCGVNLSNNTGFGAHSPQTQSHEMGHHYNCLRDEYEDNIGTECGHSIMGTAFSANSNFCWCTSQKSGPNNNTCDFQKGDHGHSPSPPNITAQKSGTAWINLFARAPYPAMASTPDNFDFIPFDFNDLYARNLSNGNF